MVMASGSFAMAQSDNNANPDAPGQDRVCLVTTDNPGSFNDADVASTKWLPRKAAEQQASKNPDTMKVFDYDNDPLADRVQVLAPRWLGSGDAMTIHRGRRDGTPSALAIEAIAPDGYAGPIRLIVGVDVDGRVLGVRITEHRETPGLGDPIDASRSDWIQSFVGRSIGQPPEARWTVRKDGGEFDQFAGATVSPRAVVHAVRRVLLFVTAHGVELQRADAGEELRFVDGPR